MRTLWKLFLLQALLVVSTQLALADPPSNCTFGPLPKEQALSSLRKMNCEINGEPREALVYAPKLTATGKQMPVIFAFHGHGGSMKGTAQQMHLHTLWTDAIVVYPQGLPSESKHDPNGDRPGWQIEKGTNGDRDLKFFDAMLDTLKQTYTVDNTRIYTTGFSNGGIFSYLLWAERSNVIAAVGEVAGRLGDSENLTKPRAFLAVAGTADTTNPFAVQQQSIEAARQADSATGQGQPCGQFCTWYSSTSNTPVKTFIHPGGHVYPSWAPAEIVKFFKNHKQL